jgi:Peptidase family S41
MTQKAVQSHRAKTTRTKSRTGVTRARTAASKAVNQGATMTLDQFLSQLGGLSKAQREKLVEQASVLIERLYVHLPLKRAMHATEPVQRLKLLLHRFEGLSERQFHDEMISIFTDLRDLHTNYILPDPYRSKTAFLPFLIEDYIEGGARKYLVTKMLAGFAHPQFKPGVTITHWNGVPLERAIELNAERQAGSNPDARRARGLEAMTIRSMALSSPPDERWVIIGFTDADGVAREIKIDWHVFEPDPSPNGVDPFSARGATALGIDAQTEAVRRAKKRLFNEKAVRVELSTRAKLDLAQDSTMPDVFSFRTVSTPSGTFGYIRIWTFNVDDADAFIQEFVRIAALLPQNGLIIDVRGNGGGLITASEGLLQVLTPNRIEPTLLSFINTPLTLELCQKNAFIKQWTPSIKEAIETSEAYSQGFPVDDPTQSNRVGQRYQGPVLLITDALCYSATDIFAAGFQDNRVGVVLGVHARTGAGGANVWTHELLRQLLPGAGSPFTPLPKGASFRVAIRRVMRVGLSAGVPLEDLGVSADKRHDMTKNDLLNANEDLIKKAAGLLAQQPVFSLQATVGPVAAGVRTVTAQTAGIDRVDALVDGRPRQSADVQNGTNQFAIPKPGSGAHHLELRGFRADALKVVLHLDL